jgi:hypothetical protein
LAFLRSRMPDNQIRIISLAKALSKERHRVIEKGLSLSVRRLN